MLAGQCLVVSCMKNVNAIRNRYSGWSQSSWWPEGTLAWLIDGSVLYFIIPPECAYHTFLQRSSLLKSCIH